MALAVQSTEVRNVASLIKMFQVLNSFLRILNPVFVKIKNIKCKTALYHNDVASGSEISCHAIKSINH